MGTKGEQRKIYKVSKELLAVIVRGSTYYVDDIDNYCKERFASIQRKHGVMAVLGALPHLIQKLSERPEMVIKSGDIKETVKLLYKPLEDYYDDLAYMRAKTALG